MIDFPASLLAVGGARTGIAPAHLLDIEDVNGNLYYFSDRAVSALPALQSAAPAGLSAPATPDTGEYIAWSRPTTCGSGLGNGDGSVSVTLDGGSVTETGSGVMSNPNWIKWGAFALPVLPAGATVTRMYVTGLLTTNHQPNGFAPGATMILLAPSYPWSGQFSTEIFSGSGMWSSVLSTFTPCYQYYDTLYMGKMNYYAYFSSIAVAVYYARSSGGSGGSGSGSSIYKPWILSVPEFTFHRSSVTDLGKFVLQNLSGDTLARDAEKLIRASTFEGATFIYRYWQPDAQAAWREIHGKLTIPDGGVGVDTWTLDASSLITPADVDMPEKQLCETCQWRWGSLQCGSQEATECSYSYESCQVPDRFFGVLNSYEKNYGESTANVVSRVVNRRRRF